VSSAPAIRRPDPGRAAPPTGRGPVAFAIAVAAVLVVVVAGLAPLCASAEVAAPVDPGLSRDRLVALPWGETPSDLLDRARDAVGGVSFRGEVEVSWLDGNRGRSVRVPVVDDAGVLWVGDRRAVGAGTVRLLRASRGGWEQLWSGGSPTGREPEPDAKYRLRRAGSGRVAGRPVTIVEAVLLSDSTVRERVFLDDATGLVLRRDDLDGTGTEIRSVGFREISGLAPVDGRPGTLPAPYPRGPEIRRVDSVPHPYRAPERAGHGFVLADRFRRPGGDVQLFYSDGVFALSVFEQRGRLDWSALPPGGPPVEAYGRRVRTYHTPGGTTVVWEASGVVYTCVTDAPASEIESVLASFPARGSRGAWSRVTDLVLRPFRWG